jgi:hypothetical protein
MKKCEKPQRCSPEWDVSYLDAIASYLFQIGEILERAFPEPEPGCIMHDTDEECRRKPDGCRL